MTGQPEQTPPILGADGIKAAREIAKWCEDEYDATVRTAKMQLAYVWVLVVVGMITLLFLPVVVEWIDTKLLEEKLPKKVVGDANVAVEVLTTNYEKLKEEADKLQVARDRLDAEVETAEAERDALETKLRADLSQPYAVWERGAADEEATIDWAQVTPYELLQAQDGRILLGARLRTARATVLISEDGRLWTDGTIAVPDPALDRSTTNYDIEWVRDLAETSDGFYGVGTGGRQRDRPFVVRSEDGLDWEVILPNQSVPLAPGSLSDIAADPVGEKGVIIGGRVRTDVGSEARLSRVTVDPAGVVEVTELLDGPTAQQGSVVDVFVDPNGKITAAAQLPNGEDWRAHVLEEPSWRPVPVFGEASASVITGLVMGPSGLLAYGYIREDERRLPALAQRAPDGSWEQVPLPPNLPAPMRELVMRKDGTLVGIAAKMVYWTDPEGVWFAQELASGQLYAIVVTESDDVILAASRSAPLRLVRDISVAELTVDNLGRADLFPEEAFILPKGSHEAQAALGRRLIGVATREQRRADQQAFLDAARELEQDQLAAITNVGSANNALEEALRTSEPVRQAISMGTRVAIIALLIFLVQIVVNRYRYLQRLAGFYRARGHAFRLIAASDPEQPMPMLQDVTLTELMNALSPDAIGFDKAADPPTHHVSSLLQTALKR